ncbi:MAG: ribosome maturation factor RimM [Gemmatimonadaceae bacterium]
MAAPEWVIVGRVRKVHGLQGELVVEAITDRPGEIFAPGRRVVAGTATARIGREPRDFTVVRSRPFKGGFIIAFEGLSDCDEAEKWRGRFLFIPGTELAPLEEGEVYVHDLHGLRVALTDGTEVGTITDVYELPQGLGLDVKRDGRPSVVVPYRAGVVREVDVAGGLMVIDPPAGLLD